MSAIYEKMTRFRPGRSSKKGYVAVTTFIILATYPLCFKSYVLSQKDYFLIAFFFLVPMMRTNSPKDKKVNRTQKVTFVVSPVFT